MGMREYPKNLPLIPIYNSVDLCVSCAKVWLEVSGAPDFNHCSEMVDSSRSLDTLTDSQRAEYMNLRDFTQCPLYVSK